MSEERRDGDLARNRALAAASRVRILQALRGRPLDVHELARLVDLHVSTVRFHMRALEGAGLVERRVEREGRPGRPRVAYVGVAGDEPESARRYLLLSRILASSIAGRVPGPAEVAGDAGMEWGRAVARERGLPRGPEADLRQLAAMLEDLGFAPEVEAGGETTTIWLGRCPFREAAESNPEVVCAVHLGLMRGALSEWGSGLRAERLEPFVEPGRCRAVLSEGTGP